MSQAFQGAKAKYPCMEKMAFSLIMALRKLCSYFQAYTIVVMTNQPIRKAMCKLDAADRMVQQVVELSQFDIEYRPRTTIKAQALAKFIMEFTLPNPDQEAKYWTIYSDGSSVTGLEGVGVIMMSPESDVLKYGVQLQFQATNNEARYEAVIASLKVAKALGVKNLRLRTDSKLIVVKITNEYEAKEERMKKYLQLTSQLINEFDDVRLELTPRKKTQLLMRLLDLHQLKMLQQSQACSWGFRQSPVLTDYRPFRFKN